VSVFRQLPALPVRHFRQHQSRGFDSPLRRSIKLASR